MNSKILRVCSFIVLVPVAALSGLLALFWILVASKSHGNDVYAWLLFAALSAGSCGLCIGVLWHLKEIPLWISIIVGVLAIFFLVTMFQGMAGSAKL